MKSINLELTAEKLTQWIGSTASLITHTILFAAALLAGIFGFKWDQILLVLTTVVSLEAIYLSIFIQMTVNKTTQSLKVVESDLDEIQEDVDEIQEDVGEIQTDIDEIQKDVDEVQEDVSEIQEGEQYRTLAEVRDELARLVKDIEKLSQIQH